MAASVHPPHERGELRFNWILDRRNDLIWYIGSALVGYAYIFLIWLMVGRTAGDPLHDVLGTLRLGGIQLDITLNLLVVLSWAYLVDAPHLFATLARTFFDPEERQLRRTELRRSWLWFGFGPLAILTPYLLGAVLAPFGLRLSGFLLNFGWLVYFIFFRLWAYYHVVRQHWGFFSLYKNKNNDFHNPLNNKVDAWFFNLSMYLPLVLFMTSEFYAQTPGFPDLGLRTLFYHEISIGAVIYPQAWTLYLLVLVGYAGWQVYRWWHGAMLNGPKLLLMALLVPLHLLAFSSPVMVLFLVPLVTVGHNLQYHRIVWSYGRNKYAREERPAFSWTRRIFSSVALYALLGILFTFALYKGPWIELVKSATGLTLDRSLLNSLSMMAGVIDPSRLNLGEKIFAAFLTGWAMQHYYLDSKIWRVRKDQMVQKNLNLQ